MGELRRTPDGRVLERLEDGTIIERPDLAQGAPVGGVVLPPAPPEPTPPPPRTPAGSATEGAPKGFAWVDPNNPSAGVYPIQGLPKEAREGAAQGLTPQIRADAIQAYKDAEAIDRQIEVLERLYDQGPGSTSGVMGVQDFFAGPNAINNRFNTAANTLRGPIKRALGFTGGEANVVAEQEAIYGPFIPRSANFDADILGKIENLRTLANDARQRSIATLGGIPDASGNIQPIGEQPQISAFDVISTVNTQGPTAAAPRADVGSGQTIAEEYPPRMVATHDEMVRRLLSEGNGRLDPQAYAAERDRLFREFGYQSNPQSSAEWATGINDYLDAGGRTVPSGILPLERIATRTETMRNNLVNNPATATAVGGANAIGLGIPEAVAPDQYAALSDAQAPFVMGGEIAGTIPAVTGLGAIGRQTIGRAIPRLLGSQSPRGAGFVNAIRQGRADTLGQFGRNVATDATYGGIYGGVTEGDPLTGAALAATGSTIGQGLTLPGAAAIGGMRLTDEARQLLDAGVPMSVGRQTGFGRAEDILSSLPFANEAVRNRQIDSFVGFDEAAFRQAASPAERLSNPIAPNVQGVGRQALKDLRKVEKEAYDRALAGVNAPVDGGFTQDFAGVVSAVQGLPDDYRRAAEAVMRTRVANAVKGGVLSGKAYQQAIRGIRSAKSKASQVGVSGNEDQYIAALEKAEDALTGIIQRGAGQSNIDDLALANQIYSNRKILENASLDRAKVGSRSGEVEVFTPSQLIESARVAERRYGTGEDLLQFGQAGQRVLPSTVPNSATFDRAIAAGVLASAAGAGGAFGYDQAQGAQSAQDAAGGTVGTIGAIGALGGLLGTRGGQQALEAILLTRPQGMRAVGEGIRRRRGLFGSAAVPVALEYQ